MEDYILLSYLRRVPVGEKKILETCPETLNMKCYTCMKLLYQFQGKGVEFFPKLTQVNKKTNKRMKAA